MAQNETADATMMTGAQLAPPVLVVVLQSKAGHQLASEE